MTTRVRRQPRLWLRPVYMSVMLGGGIAVVAGVAMVFPPLALVLGGLGLLVLGSVGLTLEGRR